MKYLIILIACTFFYTSATSQVRHTVSGTITDASNGEQLINVTVYTKTNQAVISNFYGHYSINLKPGETELFIYSYGYKKVHYTLLAKDTLINVALIPIENVLEEVVVKAPRIELTSPQAGIISLKTETVKKMPALLGEADLLKVLQTLPGVKGGTEGTGGIYVRGGSPDQNLILLDGLPLYNTSHAFGLVSIFNSNAISGFTFYKGGIPARYGGRISSVLDIKMKEGNTKKVSGEVNLGLISSSLTLEGPIFKDKTSFIVSGRRTFYDLVTKPFAKNNLPIYYFYDLNGKINHVLNKKNKIYLSLYSGSDYTGTKYKSSSNDFNSRYESSDELGWSNFSGSLRWNYLINKNLFSNVSLLYSKYQFKIEQNNVETYDSDGKLDNFLNRYTSGIKDLGIRWDLEYNTPKNYIIRFGTGLIGHEFNPGIKLIVDPQDSSRNAIDTTFHHKTNVNESFIYLENEINIKKLSLNVGFHLSVFNVPGKNYGNLQPRLAAKYQITPMLSAKLSYCKLSQYLHLLSNSTIGMPTDLWLPSTKKIKPQQANQFSFGLYYDISGKYILSSEVYYKTMDNLIEYKEGASFYQLNESWEDKVEIGKGKSKGIEIFVQKPEGKVSGWIGATLSKTDRLFSGLNNGVWFPFRYDSRVDISMVGIYKLSENININTVWVFHSGNAVTLATGKIKTFPSDTAGNNFNNWIPNITSKNNFRTPSYHRLDFSIDFIKQKKYFTRTWTFGIYNLYNRLNAFYIYADLEGKTPTIKKLTIFPILPYFKFSIRI